MLLIFSSILSSCQVHVQFLPFTVGVLSKFCHSCSLAISLYRGGHILFVREALISMSFNLQVLVMFLVYLASTRVVPIPSCPLYLSFIALQPPRFTWSSLFLFSTAVLSIVFNSVVFFLSTFQPLKVLWVHSFVEEAT